MKEGGGGLQAHSSRAGWTVACSGLGVCCRGRLWSSDCWLSRVLLAHGLSRPSSLLSRSLLVLGCPDWRLSRVLLAVGARGNCGMTATIAQHVETPKGGGNKKERTLNTKGIVDQLGKLGSAAKTTTHKRKQGICPSENAKTAEIRRRGEGQTECFRDFDGFATNKEQLPWLNH